MTTPPPASEMPQPPPQALHYALANAQQVQIHQIGEDGQVQVVCTLLVSLCPQRRGEAGAGAWPMGGGHDQRPLSFWVMLWYLGVGSACHFKVQVVRGASSCISQTRSVPAGVCLCHQPLVAPPHVLPWWPLSHLRVRPFHCP